MLVSFFRNVYYRNGCYDNVKTQIKISFLQEIQGFLLILANAMMFFGCNFYTNVCRFARSPIRQHE